MTEQELVFEILVKEAMVRGLKKMAISEALFEKARHLRMGRAGVAEAKMWGARGSPLGPKMEAQRTAALAALQARPKREFGATGFRADPADRALLRLSRESEKSYKRAIGDPLWHPYHQRRYGTPAEANA